MTTFADLITSEATTKRKAVMQLSRKDEGYRADNDQWYENYQHNRRITTAKQEQEVADKVIALQELAGMIEELKASVPNQVQAILDFVKQHDLDHLVSFDAWYDPQWALDGILQADVEYDAIKWAHSDHNC